MLTAVFGNQQVSAGIHGIGFVDSTNNVGCSYGGRGSASAVQLAVGLLLLGLLRGRLRGWRRSAR